MSFSVKLNDFMEVWAHKNKKTKGNTMNLNEIDRYVVSQS